MDDNVTIQPTAHHQGTFILLCGPECSEALPALARLLPALKLVIVPAKAAESRPALEIVERLVDEENDSGIPPSRVVVGGRAQASIVAASIARTSRHMLAGVVCLGSSEPGGASIVRDDASVPVLHVHEDVGRGTTERALEEVAEFVRSRTAIEKIVVGARAEHRATFVFLHGMAQTGRQLMEQVRPLTDSLPFVKFVFPTAPKLALSYYEGGRLRPAWFNCYSMDELTAPSGPRNYSGLEKAAGWVAQLVQDELSEDIAASQIFLGGFSQGGVLGLYACLTRRLGVAGIVGLSSFVIALDRVSAGLHGRPVHTPVLMRQGGRDPVVDPAKPAAGVARLRALGCNIDFQICDGLAHEIDAQELRDVHAFVTSHCPRSKL